MKKYRAEGGVAVVPAMHRIDGDIRDELDMRHQQTDEQMMNTVHIVRPIAVRVNHALPVSQAETEEFYKQTEHLPLAQVHELFKESSEWYNYYTRNSFSPNAYMLDRELGARNPSPGDERKRRLSDEIRDNKDNDDCMVDSQQQQENDTPILIRPSPIRVHKPTALRVNHAIPKLIEEARREDQRCVSPITLYSSHSANAINRPNENNLLPRLICTQVNLVEAAKEGLLQALAVSGGETSAPEFTSNLDILIQNAQHQSPQGLWLTLTKPTFFDNLGENDSGDPMYTLARMSFDMFSPAQLVCSLQGNFNEVQTVQSHDVIVPKNLREEVSDQATVLQTYNVITAFTIEPPQAAFPDAPNSDVTRPIRGIMTTYGYQIADPDSNYRDSVWITGGKIEPNTDPQDVSDWKRLFGSHPPQHSMGQKARLLAVKLLMGAELPTGMDPDGSLEYTFTRPLGGHGLAYIDTLYCDETLRVVRGHRGTVFCFCRMPDPK